MSRIPHHVTQRGVRRSNVFLDEADHLLYHKLLGHYAHQFELSITAYCQMTNHIHIVGVPEHKDSIAKVFRDCHGAYAAEFNKKYGKSGHVWQARPFSYVLDEPHACAAIRYVERNPVRAHMVEHAEDYRWSSARRHCGIERDPLLSLGSFSLSGVTDWGAWLAGRPDFESEHRIRARTYTGRRCGDDAFVRKVEGIVGRRLVHGNPGQKLRIKIHDNTCCEVRLKTTASDAEK